MPPDLAMTPYAVILGEGPPPTPCVCGPDKGVGGGPPPHWHQDDDRDEKVFSLEYTVLSPSWPGLTRPPVTFPAATPPVAAGPAKPGQGNGEDPSSRKAYPDAYGPPPVITVGP